MMSILLELKRALNVNLLLFLISFLIFRTIFFTPVFSDETIYINMAKAITNGLMPYKDFFYAHPPLQLFLLAPLAYFRNFFLIKFFISIIGILNIFFVYLISKEIFDEESGLISSISFLLFPGFLIFGNLAMGTFEALLFFLLSFYFLLNKKFFISNIFLTLAIFTRYLIILLIPFLFFYLFKNYKKKFKKYMAIFVLLNFLTFFALNLLTENNFFIDTVLYHFSANIGVRAKISKQYFALGFFTIFISIVCLAYAYFENDRKILVFSAYPLIFDFFILITFKQVIYHYFAFALPFIFIGFGRALRNSKLLIVKIFLIMILLLTFFTNLKSLEFYYDKNRNLIFDELTNYTLENTKDEDLIFGSAIPTNYISFVTNRKIVNNYFDSDLKFINFVGKERILKEVNSNPKLLFVTKEYLDFFKQDYEIIKEFNKPGYYHLFIMKRKF